jgi:hypothetical protein
MTSNNPTTLHNDIQLNYVQHNNTYPKTLNNDSLHKLQSV